jgi:hypothetical protein
MRFPRSARKRLVLLTAFAVVALATAGGLAYAAIPDSSGVIHGCYKAAGGGLRVIDTDKGATCTTGEKSLNWNQTGPQGTTGPRGPSDAYFARMINEQLIHRYRDGGNTLVTLDLPAGDYAVTAKVELADNSDAFVDAECEIISGGTSVDPGQLFHHTPVSIGISLLATVSGPTTVGVHCFTFDATGLIAINHGTAILATQVGTIHEQ